MGIVEVGGKVSSVDTSRLRKIVNMAGRHGVLAVQIQSYADSSALLEVAFAGGYRERASFASFTVCKGWVAARRNLAGAPLNVDGYDCGTVNPQHLVLTGSLAPERAPAFYRA